MPRKKVVDYKKLVEMVEAEVPRNEIMQQLDISTALQLKTLYVDALASMGRIPQVVNTRSNAASPMDVKSMELFINKRGSLIVPKEVINSMGFEVGDTFAVRKTAAGVSLKKV